MRNLGCAILVSLLGTGVAASAQDASREKSKTKITVEDGKDVTITGCVRRTDEGNLTLTHGAGKEGAVGAYILLTDKDDLDEHIGHRVEIKGKAVDKGDGRLKIKTESEVRTSEGDRRKRESTTEVEGDLDGLPYLGVKSVRMLASVCP